MNHLPPAFFLHYNLTFQFKLLDQDRDVDPDVLRAYPTTEYRCMLGAR